MTGKPMIAEEKPSRLALPRWRLNMLRAAYVPLVIGLAFIQLPLLAELGPDWELMHGVVVSMLSALWFLCVIGLFRPVMMVPALLLEIIWKLLWLGFVGVPAWFAGSMDPSIAENLFACVLVVPIILLVPWDFVIKKIAAPECL